MKKKAIIGVAIGALVLAAKKSEAAGFSIYEGSARGSAMGGALVGSPGDAAANCYNPAGLTDLNGTHTLFGASLLKPEMDCRVDGARNRMDSDWYEIPQLYGSQQLLDDLYFGLGMYTEYGLGSKWAKNWVLRADSTETTLKTTTLNPNLAYKVTDRLSLAAGFRAVWLDFTHRRTPYSNSLLGATPYGPVYGDMSTKIHGDSWGYGWLAAMQYKILDNLQWGTVYRSHVVERVAGHIEMDSNMRLGNQPIANTSLPDGYARAKGNIDLPPSIATGLNYQPTGKLNLGGAVTYTQWSKYDWLKMYFGDTAPTQMPQLNDQKDWDDVFRFSLGAEYEFIKDWTVMAGYVYDIDPIKSKHTDTMIPPGDRHIFSLGLGYSFFGWNVCTSYAYTYVDEVDRTVGGYEAEFRNGCCHILSTSLSTSF